MTREDVKALMRNSQFGFVATVEHVGAGASADVPIDEQTAVMRVDLVLHAPDMFVGLEGQRITVQLAGDLDAPAPGDQVATFGDGLAFGETLAVTEVGRLPLDEVLPHADLAPDAAPGPPMASLQSEIADEKLRDHASGAGDAVVIGVVTSLQQAGPATYAEHDPLWWIATIDVRQVVRGDVAEGPLQVLYPNSLDTRWRAVPKPKASQDGLWILHPAPDGLAELAAWQLEHAEDRQPVEGLRRLQPEEG
jgi:hypothetical protein